MLKLTSLAASLLVMSTVFCAARIAFLWNHVHDLDAAFRLMPGWLALVPLGAGAALAACLFAAVCGHLHGLLWKPRPARETGRPRRGLDLGDVVARIDERPASTLSTVS